MAYRRRQRYYRSARKNIHDSQPTAVFSGDKVKEKLFVAGIALLSIGFLKGIIFGYLAGKKH